MTDAVGRRLPDSAHTSRPWRIHAIASDFRLEDVWALPTPGGPDDFPRLVELFRAYDPEESSSGVIRALFAIRWKIGELLGWEDPAERRAARTDDDAPPPFTLMYRDDREWAAEIVNATVHGILHLGWVPDGNGGWRGQMAVLVKPNGLLGSAYMLAITPFRYLLVYPAMLRELGRRWRYPGVSIQR